MQESPKNRASKIESEHADEHRHSEEKHDHDHGDGDGKHGCDDAPVEEDVIEYDDGSDDGLSSSEGSSQSSEDAKEEGLLSKGFNAVTDNVVMKGFGTGMGALGGAISGLAGFKQEGEEEDRTGEKSANDLKKIFLEKYSIQFEIPS